MQPNEEVRVSLSETLEMSLQKSNEDINNRRGEMFVVCVKEARSKIGGLLSEC